MDIFSPHAMFPRSFQRLGIACSMAAPQALFVCNAVYGKEREVGNQVITDTEEHALIVKAKNGDKDAFVALVAAYKGVLYNLAIRLTGSYDVADDMVQESFLHAYAAIGTFNSKKRFYSWIYTICLNVLRDYLRKRKNMADRSEDIERRFHISSAPGPKDFLLQKELHNIIIDALQRLPLPLRECIVLRFFHDLSFSEVSEICSISENAAKKRVYKALLLMQQYLPQDLLDNQT